MEEKKVDYVKEIVDTVIYFAILFLIVLLIHTFIGEQIKVRGSSMENTLHNGNRLFLEKLTYRFGEPKRFDIIVFKPQNSGKDVYYIKRIIGLPNETVQIIGEQIYIDGEVLEEPYGNDPIEHAGIASEPIVLLDDEYFVLGDNRNNSSDSRNPSVGVVKSDSIEGRAWVRIWPFNEIDVLKHQ
jgi:signal peptidase I